MITAALSDILIVGGELLLGLLVVVWIFCSVKAVVDANRQIDKDRRFQP